MRGAIVLVAFVLPLAALAQTPAASAPPAAAPAAKPPAGGATQPSANPAAAQIESLQQRLLASQQTIATLERELAAAKDRGVVMDQCRMKNTRLVVLSRKLIEGYDKRWHEGRHDPLQAGRRRFEFELQALSDAVYENRVDVPVPPLPGDKTKPAAAPVAPAPAPAAPAPQSPANGH